MIKIIFISYKLMKTTSEDNKMKFDYKQLHFNYPFQILHAVLSNIRINLNAIQIWHLVVFHFSPFFHYNYGKTLYVNNMQNTNQNPIHIRKDTCMQVLIKPRINKVIFIKLYLSVPPLVVQVRSVNHC